MIWLAKSDNIVPLATKTATGTGNPKNQVIEVPGGEFFFMVKGNAIEGDEVPLAVDVQFSWEDSPRRYHNEVLQANLASILIFCSWSSLFCKLQLHFYVGYGYG